MTTNNILLKVAIVALALSVGAVLADDDTNNEPKVFCTVCSNGNVAMGAGSIGGELCQDLDKMGRAEKFTREECNIIQSAASVAPDDPCQCDDPLTIQPSPHPTIGRLTPEPTPSPTQNPTAAPTPRPTPCTLFCLVLFCFFCYCCVRFVIAVFWLVGWLVGWLLCLLCSVLFCLDNQADGSKECVCVCVRVRVLCVLCCIVLCCVVFCFVSLTTSVDKSNLWLFVTMNIYYPPFITWRLRYATTLHFFGLWRKVWTSSLLPSVYEFLS